MKWKIIWGLFLDLQSPPVTWDPMIFRVEEIWKALKVKVFFGDSSQDLFIPDRWRSFHYGVKALQLHPGRLTWNLQIDHLERKKSSSRPSFSGSMLVFRECILLALATPHSSSLTHYLDPASSPKAHRTGTGKACSFASSSKKPIPNYIP